MNSYKMVFATALLGSVFALTACEITPENNRDRAHYHYSERQLSPEQRAEWQKRRENRQERREDMRDYRQDRREDMRDYRNENREAQREKFEQACRGKRIGERVTIQWNRHSIEGKCEVRFNPNQPTYKR